MPAEFRVADSKANLGEGISLTVKPLGFIVSGVTDISEAAKVLGCKGGKAKTKAKIAAARRNGRKGGRPGKKKAA